MTRRSAVAGLAVAVLLGAAPALARKPCPPGRFAVRGEALVDPSVPDGTDEVLLHGTNVLVQSGCPATKARVRAKRKNTLVRARWSACGANGPRRLEARIDAATCATMRGVLSTGKSRKEFVAFRQAAGNAVGGTFAAIQERIFTGRGARSRPVTVRFPRSDSTFVRVRPTRASSTFPPPTRPHRARERYGSPPAIRTRASCRGSSTAGCSSARAP